MRGVSGVYRGVEEEAYMERAEGGDTYINDMRERSRRQVSLTFVASCTPRRSSPIAPESRGRCGPARGVPTMPTPDSIERGNTEHKHVVSFFKTQKIMEHEMLSVS